MGGKGGEKKKKKNTHTVHKSEITVKAVESWDILWKKKKTKKKKKKKQTNHIQVRLHQEAINL